MNCSEELYEGYPAVRLETTAWSALVVPTLGAKVISLIARATGDEWLWREPGRPLRPAVFGAAFGDYDISGWDECFPGIGVGPYPDAPWQGQLIPDHGELWSRPWSYAVETDGLRMWIEGVNFPYIFERRLTARADGALVVSYTVTNRESAPMRYVWAAHPLFTVRPGMHIVLPEGTNVVVDFSKDDRLGGLLAQHSWPFTHDTRGDRVDLSVIAGPELGSADKLYAVDLSAGWGMLHDPRTGDYLALSFDTASIPHLGVWINQGGWPLDAPPSFNVALEPCHGYPDRLDVACERGAAGVLPPQASSTWSFTLHCGRADQISAIRSLVS